MRAAGASCSAAPPAGPRWPARGCSTRTATATCSRCRCRTAVAYDPAFAYELAVIIQDGIRRMYEERREHLLLPDGDERAVRDAADAGGRARGDPQGAVPLPRRPAKQGEAAGAAVRQRRHPARGRSRRRRCSRRSTAWPPTSGASPATASCTATAHECERWNMLHPAETPRVPYVDRVPRRTRRASFVAASDYLKALPDSIARWVPRPLVALGTDGFGRSEGRAGAARASSRSTPASSRSPRSPRSLARRPDRGEGGRAIEGLDIDPEKPTRRDLTIEEWCETRRSRYRPRLKRA